MFYIQVSNGLLEPGHAGRIGPAVWVFMWCIDKITLIDDDGNGWVLGRKPIITAEICKALGFPQRTVERDIARLKNGGYIKTIRTPRGNQIAVVKAKKAFRKNRGNAVDNLRTSKGLENREPPKMAVRTAKNGGSNIRQYPKDSINTSNINNKNLRKLKTQKAKLLEHVKM